MFSPAFPLEISRRILSSIMDSSFNPAGHVLGNREIPIIARRISSLEYSSHRAILVSGYKLHCQCLSRLCRVSRNFKDEIQPILYACVIVDSAENADLLEEALRRNPGLARLVQSIIILPHPWSIVYTRVIQSLVNHCLSLEAYQDYSLYARINDFLDCIDLPVGARLKKICARSLLPYSNFFKSPIQLSSLVSLELIATEPSPLDNVISFPNLKSLRIGINDCTLHKCVFPMLRHLYIGSGYRDKQYYSGNPGVHPLISALLWKISYSRLFRKVGHVQRRHRIGRNIPIAAIFAHQLHRRLRLVVPDMEYPIFRYEPGSSANRKHWHSWCY